MYGLYCDGLVSELLGSYEITKCSPVRDGRTPHLVKSKSTMAGLLDYGRPESQKTVKTQPDQEIKILENFDII